MITSPVFWNIFEVVVNIYEGFLLIWFIDSVLTPKTRNRITYFSFSLLSAAVLSVFLLTDALSLEVAFSDSWIYIVFGIYIVLFHKDKWYVKLLWFSVLWIMVNSALTCVYYVFSLVTGKSFDILLEPGYFRLAAVLISNLILFLLLYFIVRLYRSMKQHDYMTFQPCILLVLINIAAIAIQEAIFRLFPDGDVTVILFTLIHLLTVIICVMSLILYKVIYHYAEENALIHRIEAQRMETEERLEEIKEIYSYVQKTQHDFRKHMQVVEKMISDGNAEESQAYLQDVQSKMKNLFSTGCLALDSALTIKEETMDAHGITFIYELCDLQKHPLSDTDFCTIIMNMLDNAIEGVLRYQNDLSEHYVRLDIRHIHDMLMIRCENPCTLLPMKQERMRFLSEKRASGKGMGISIIEDIANEADGTCSFTQKDGHFTAIVNIKYSIEEDTK